MVGTLDNADPQSVIEALDASGIAYVRSTVNGNILLNINGMGQVSYREAVRLGVINFSCA
ncbi:hypothetical protein H4P12_02900 [Paracoccus sp. 11-3]|uniref:Uncharacterized protein n=1 Tax=Paracoccus amoyensis TaxID=2760093 RepID=A0A926G4Q7_9RHOB|nr:hypothetical protein [Paracoccus amoyensis]MBC9245683.1 hypothetical protein [Paracoccus amoyensis]